jgi:KDO2-lipid IV(A) lauroyltransferase
MLVSRLLGQLLYAGAWLLGRLPLGAARALGRATGAWARWRNTREARVARRNLELVRPDLDGPAREAMLRAILRHTGMNALETLRVWTRPRADNLRLVRAIHGEQHLAAAQAQGRGVILCVPHYGNWELIIEAMAARAPFALVYRVPEKGFGDGFLRRARAGDNITLVPAEANAMRPLWKHLKAGGIVGITPDQQPKLGSGEFAPFFGMPALTLTLIPRLAERSGAPVVVGFVERVDDGFEVHFEPGDPRIADPDAVVATAAMNAQVEAVARRDFAQYQWTYKRYTRRPPGSGERNPYRPDCY